jgi:hypothetical protein
MRRSWIETLVVNIYKRLLSDIDVGMETRRRQNDPQSEFSQQTRDKSASFMSPRSRDI